MTADVFLDEAKLEQTEKIFILAWEAWQQNISLDFKIILL